MSCGSAPLLLASGQVPARSRALFNFLYGATATCFLILTRWQTGFTGIRDGEASNPGPTFSASDGVTTPLPPSQDWNLRFRSLVHVPGSSCRRPLLVSCPSRQPLHFPFSPCPGPLHPPLSHLLLHPARSRRSPPVLHCSHCSSSQPFSSSGRRSHRPVLVSPLPSPRWGLLSCPLLSRPFSPLSRMGHVQFHASSHRCSSCGTAHWRHPDGLASRARFQCL